MQCNETHISGPCKFFVVVVVVKDRRRYEKSHAAVCAFLGRKARLGGEGTPTVPLRTGRVRFLTGIHSGMCSTVSLSRESRPSLAALTGDREKSEKTFDTFEALLPRAQGQTSSLPSPASLAYRRLGTLAF